MYNNLRFYNKIGCVSYKSDHVDRNFASCASMSFSDIFDEVPMVSLRADGASDI